MKGMKVFLIIFLLAIISCFLCAHKLFAQDKIIAIVNNDVITQKDLQEFTNFMKMQLAQQYSGRELEKRIQDTQGELLNKLIEDRLILQEAKKSNIKVEEARVKARLNEIKIRYPSEFDFQQDLSRQGLVPADIETKIKEQMLMHGVIEEEVRSKVSVKPEEVTVFYNENKDKFVSPEEREVLMVALENEDQAKSFSFNFRSGEKLEDLAVRYPVNVNRITARLDGELRKDIETVIVGLHINEISSPVKIDDKFYVFKLENITPAKPMPLSEAQENVYNYLAGAKMQEVLSKWLDGLKKDAYIKIIP
jgi:parvulin-like peptidyl-prolyl isomerase